MAAWFLDSEKQVLVGLSVDLWCKRESVSNISALRSVLLHRRFWSEICPQREADICMDLALGEGATS
jgi:hypothetical protein